MPEAYNIFVYANKIIAVKNYLLLIPLLFIVIACSAGNNSTTNNMVAKADSYNFAALIVHNSFYNVPLESACPGIPINRDPNLQPPVPKCDLVTNSPAQIAEGCDVNINEPDSLGARLAKSVVGIALPYESSSWYDVKCTAIIIESKWILTAAHCVTNTKINTISRGDFKLTIQNLLVVPWQEAYNGVPTSFNNESIHIIKFPVKAIYIPNHYNYHSETYTPPYFSYLKDDFALIELESSLPNDYQPITIESTFNMPAGSQLWAAGYGYNESQTQDEKLYFRDIYYYSKLYNTDSNVWNPGRGIFLPGPSKTSGTDYGMLYTTGSIPKYTKSQPPSAWLFTGSGDSGSPLLYYNQSTHRLSIIAILSGGVYCNYAGFYAPLPYSFDQNTAITTSRYTLIRQIINNTASRTDIRCVSKNYDVCYTKNIYVLNQDNNSISVYSMDEFDSLHFKETVNTGINPQAFTFASDYKYLLVANYGRASTEGTISVFKRRMDGTLIPNQIAEQLQSRIGNPVSIITVRDFYFGENIYIASHAVNTDYSSILKLLFNDESGILLPAESITIRPSYIKRIKPGDNKLFAIDSEDNSIYVVDIRPLSPNNVMENLDYPTDITAGSELITNSGSNQIVSGDSTRMTWDSHGDKPDQIMTFNRGSNYFVYVSNFGSNNIAIFKDGENYLMFESSIPTGNQPIGMTSWNDSQLFVVNESDNTLWRYEILPDGMLANKQSVATGPRPIAVLAN